MLRQVRIIKCFHHSYDVRILFSYDLDLDTRLAEETTVLVETYTVQTIRAIRRIANPLTKL
jgi:hypothetical protein